MKKQVDTSEIVARLPWEESEDLEFKSAKGGLPGSVWSTYSAMANTRGGIIILGVKDDGTLVGVENIAKIKKDFWNTINNKSKVNENVLQSEDVQELTYLSRNFLAIYIREVSYRKKPIYTGGNPLYGTYRRNAEGDYLCTEQEVRRMLMDQSEESADNKLLDGFGLDDIDLPSLHQYRHRLASRQPAHPWLSEDDKGLLKKLNGWRRCRQNGAEGLTVAGLLMFGREETIREGIPQYHVDYREKLSEAPEVRWTDRLTLDGTWAGNLYQFYIRVMQRLAADLKLPFQLNDDMVRKGETPVHEAIREALVNALIHADYYGQGGIVVQKYNDRFRFSNPGSLLISLDQLLRGGVSECRNKSLQTMFTLIGAAEKAGSGVDKIRSGWSSQHWRLPIVREQVQPDRVLWELPMVSLIPDESLERLKRQFSDRFSQLSQFEVQSLVTADIEGFVDNARMCQITGVHSADVTKQFQQLVSGGFLLQDGRGRWTQYRLPSGPDSVHKDSDSVHKDSDSVHKNSDSVHKDSDSVHKEQIGSTEWERLETIAQPAKTSKRLSPKEMESLLLKLCENQWLTRNQISKLLERHPDGLRSRYLTSMVQHKLLELRYPDKPNRVDQAYRSC